MSAVYPDGYPCPECGYDGPHTLSGDDGDGGAVYKCGSCYAEFTVPADPEGNYP